MTYALANLLRPSAAFTHSPPPTKSPVTYHASRLPLWQHEIADNGAEVVTAGDEFAPMHMIAKGRGKQTDPVTAFLKDLVRLFENCDTSPL